MISSNQPPQFPAGEFITPGPYGPKERLEYAERLRKAPDWIRNAVNGLSEEQLDTKYNNWTIRQIVHHMADSHMNAFIRFKWALTEETPLIKAYDETAWSQVVDAKTQPIEWSLALLEGLHQRWAQLVEDLEGEDLERSFYHPESGSEVLLSESLPSYVWHVEHHVAQIHWVREQNEWV